MDKDEILDQIEKLRQLDIDASNAYEQAIKAVEDPEVRSRLNEFQNDHERHITDFDKIISDWGGEVSERSPDIKGFVISGFTSIRSMMGTEGALKAMKTNEQLTNKKYGEAIEQDFPEDVMSLIRNNYQDEQRHLAYIEEQLSVMAA